jgi:hypothetical protein
MGRFVDTLITYRILKKLTTPFAETDAYKLGVIDDKGQQLIKDRNLNSQQRDAYTILDRMVFRLKKIIHKVPADNRRIASFAGALSLVREHASDTTEYVFLERDFLQYSPEAQDLQEVADFLSGRNLKTFRMHSEEGGMAVGAGFVSSANPGGNPHLQGPDIMLGYKKIARRRPVLQTKKNEKTR